jgi:hypothetical protein
MARIEGEILIYQPVDVVFDFVADSRNEPLFNPAMAGVELLTPLPLGWGHGSVHVWAGRARRCWWS